METISSVQAWVASVTFRTIITVSLGNQAPPQQKSEEKKEVNNKKYYELLGVDPKAPEADIKRAFRKKAIKEHPDKGGDPEKVHFTFSPKFMVKIV